MESLPLSVCIIARNEEHFLPSCLESVRSLAQQIVVVDTGSTDQTVAIAKHFGAEVHHFQWGDDFAAARNASLTHVTQPWVLVLDADERLTTPEQLATTLTCTGSDVGALLVTIRSKSSGRTGSAPMLYLHQDVRIIRNDTRFRYRGIIHEQIASSVIEAGFRLAPTDVVLEHDGYSLDPVTVQHKLQRNQQLLDLALQREPTNAFYHYHRAKTLIALGKLDVAWNDIEEALHTVSTDSLLRVQILNVAAMLAALQLQWNRAGEYAQESLALVPQQPFCWFVIAQAQQHFGDIDAALTAYQRSKAALLADDRHARLVGSLCIPLNELERHITMLRTHTTTHCHITQGYPMPQHHENLPLLTLAMIARDEEDTLPRCLESVQGVVDQIVVVDTGSHDQTVAVAEHFGAEVYHFPWCDDFAAARNEALRHARGQWILYLDADEQLAPESARLLRDVLEQQPPNVGGLLCTIISPHRCEGNTVETHRGAYPRLFRNYGYPRIAFRGRVHEQITPAIIECGGAIIHSPVTIYHSGYNISLDKLQQKVRRNYRLLIQHVQEEPLNGYAWFQLAQTLARMQVVEQAEQAFKLALQLGLSDSIAASAANALAHLCGTQKRYHEALQWSDFSLQRVPKQLLALNYKAHAYYALGQIEQARTCFMQLLEQLDQQRSELAVGFEIELDRHAIEQMLARCSQEAACVSMNAG